MAIAFNDRVRKRLIVLLASAAALLVLLNLAASRVEERTMHAPPPDARLSVIRMTVDSLLRERHIDPRTIRSRVITTSGQEKTRIERSVTVPPAFVSLEFNKALNQAIRPLNARVVASERPREGKILMHILLDGTVVQTVIVNTGSK
jgi:hypothetical protein